MPKITLNYANETDIPPSLKAFKIGDTNNVEVWVNTSDDAVGAELNAPLAANRDKIKGEKDAIQTKYDNLLTSSSTTAKELQEATVKLASATGVSPEDLAIITAVKSVKADAKADDVKTMLTEYPQLKSTVEQTNLERENEKLFKASGFKSQSVFNTVANNANLNPNLEKLIVKPVQENGAAVEKVFAQLKIDGVTSEQSLEDYVKSNPAWNDFLPALTAETDQTGGGWIPQSPSGTKQNGGGGGGNTKAKTLDEIIAEQNKANASKPAPLMPIAETAKT
jgi:hypothetical protein